MCVCFFVCVCVSPLRAFCFPRSRVSHVSSACNCGYLDTPLPPCPPPPRPRPTEKGEGPPYTCVCISCGFCLLWEGCGWVRRHIPVNGYRLVLLFFPPVPSSPSPFLEEGLLLLASSSSLICFVPLPPFSHHVSHFWSPPPLLPIRVVVASPVPRAMRTPSKHARNA